VWRAALHLAGGDLPPGRTVSIFFRGEIAKYVPGSGVGVIGRSELARRGGVPAAVAYASVLLSMAGMFLAAGLTAAVFAPFRFARGGSLRPLLALALVPAGFGLLHPVVLNRAKRLTERIVRREIRARIPTW